MARVALNTPAPNFELTDFNGQTVSLQQFAGHNNVVLVFNRGLF